MLVHSAAGGVGLLLCQWAKHLGATVIGTVSSETKARAARAAGCDYPIVTAQDDFVARTREITGGRGVDVVVRRRRQGHAGGLARSAGGRRDIS